MNRFAAAVEAHESASDEESRAQVWRGYFEDAPDRTALAAIGWLFAPWRPRFGRSALMHAIRTRSGLPEWLFAASLRDAGDAADGLSQLLGPASGGAFPDLATGLAALQDATVEATLDLIARLGPHARRPFLKRCLGGSLGIGQDAVAAGLAGARRLSRVSVARWLQTVARQGIEDDGLPLEESDAFGPVPFARTFLTDTRPNRGAAWCADYAWPGQRIQLARDSAGVTGWSEDLRTIAVPAPIVVMALEALPPETLLEGVLLPGGSVLIATDLLIEGGEDRRRLPLAERRVRLRELVGAGVRCPTPTSAAADLAAMRERARGHGATGLVLKHAFAAYGESPAWRVWPCDPVVVRGVLLYAQRRAGRYDLPTFGVWSGDEPVPLAKTANGLGEAERDLMDRYVRNNAIERSGPVLAVHPDWVYEIAIEEAWPSTRHRCGLKVAKARILRRREDLPPDAADSLGSVVRHFGADRPDVGPEQKAPRP